MPERVADRRKKQTEATGQPRRIPKQQRGRDRFEKILSVAMELIEKNGSDALKMSGDALRRISNEVEHRPLAMLAVAAGVGLLIGMIARR